MDARMEFVTLVKEGGRSVSEAARACGVSRPTAYRWLRRYEEEGPSGLTDRSRAPHEIPLKTPEAIGVSRAADFQGGPRAVCLVSSSRPNGGSGSGSLRR